MSEKIYAYLLRLFPSAFRRRYEEESLRLLRDRLSDERGFFRRLRLSFDLLADIIGALPQAYRNSYPKVAPVASFTPHFDGVPSFRTLQQEPIRRGTIVIAGVLSLTALATFTYVLQRPTPYYSAAQNGPMSPIESVLESLNQPLSPDSADSVPSQPRTIRNVTRSINLSGRWTASVPAMGKDADLPQGFTFRQDSAKLTGAGGPDSTEQYPIIHGFVTRESVTFELNHGTTRFLYDLKVEDNELRGTLSIRRANEIRTAKVWLERAYQR